MNPSASLSFGKFAGVLFLLAVGALLVFFGLQWLHVPAGNLVDWLAGVAIAWWLAVLTTLPWNAHFAARAVVEEAQVAREQGIAVNEEHVAFAQRLAGRFRTGAIALHLLTAAGLLALAHLGLLAVGYPAAGAALALTFARPAGRAYEHLAERLRRMQHQLHYPRQDVVELRRRVEELEEQLRHVADSLDAEAPGSWAQQVARGQATGQQALDRLDGRLEELVRTNARDHEALARQTTQEIAKLSEDARFLNQVRELIRFVKET